MTVIFGANLSDRVYLAGDSRLSEKVTDEGEEYLVTKHDNMQKVENLGYGGIIVACAGNAYLCHYLLTRLKGTKAEFRNISGLRSGLKDWLRVVTDEYYTTHDFTSATLMFAGADENGRQVVDGKDMMKVMTDFTGGYGVGTFKKDLYDAIMAKGTGVPNPKPELKIPETILFAAEISREGVHITDTKWGQYLIYGPSGLDQDDVPKQLMGQLEFENPSETFEGQFSHDVALSVALIHTLAEDKQYDTVGGCYLVMCAMHDSNTYMIDGKIMMLGPKGVPEFVNGISIDPSTSRIYRTEEKGTIHKLIPVSQYYGKGKFSLHYL